jgi:DNA repair exonuclease SbcCD nuclease subunit
MVSVSTCCGVKPSQANKALQSWTAAVIPDTQYYVRNDNDAALFTEITQWLADHAEEINLQLVLHVGDIVDKNTAKQWEHAKSSLRLLDGKVPYILAVGNHDLGRNSSDRSTMLNDYFKLSDNPLNEAIFGGYFEEGCLENAWYHFQHGNRDYLIFSLEFGPRAEVVGWANGVAEAHRDKSFILVTHEFIDHESVLLHDDGQARRTTRKSKNSPYSYGISKLGPVHSGQELWDAFVGRYSNFEMVFNGHYKAFKRTGPGAGDLKEVRDALAASRRSDRYEDGRVVHQMMFNAQWAPRGGEGWIRLLEFMPDGKTVQVKTFSPYLQRTSSDPSKAYQTEPDMQFTLELN